MSLQEQRFRLLTDAGQVYLLTLAGNAPLDAAALAELHLRGARVAVQFTGEPNLAGAVAHTVREELR